MLVSTRAAAADSAWKTALLQHWPEYTAEAGCLGLFMVSACSFGILLAHPASPLVQLIGNPLALRILMGFAMGATAVALIYSRFGKRSGAHMNPATTLAFFRLGKIESVDAVFYAVAQFVGAILGVGVCGLLYGEWLSHSTVHYVVTQPGRFGEAWAFVAEAAITFVLMSVILHISNRPGINRFTGLVAGALVMIYISVEAPVSGMSMNPARTVGSALPAGDWTAIWIYFTAPTIGMLLAAELYVRWQGAAGVLCAKLHHENEQRCIFRCGYPSSKQT